MELPIILVTCAAGTTGREIVKQLSNTGKFFVRAGVRDKEKAKQLFGSLQNVEIVQLSETDSSSKEAFSGINGVYMIISEPFPLDLCFPTWMKHAKQNKTTLCHFVFHSSIMAEADSPVLINRVTFQQQEEVKASGIPYTIIRPTFFFQNVEKFMLSTLSQGFIAGASKNRKFTVVDVRDIASVVLQIFLDPVLHFGQSYSLTTEVLTDKEQAKILSEKMKRKIHYYDLSSDRLTSELKKEGVEPLVIQAIVELEKEKTEERTLPVQPHLTQILGRSGISFVEYVNNLKL